MPVLSTTSIADTARWCQILLAQLTDDPTVFHPDSEAAATDAMSGFTAALNTVKKGNKTATGTAHAMLTAVPGLGAKRVSALLAEKSLVDLIGLTEVALAEMTVGGKRIGPDLAATLYSALRARG